ncbi:MAG: hypothetical protein RLY20_302 [Verrucomicrobiota bacterium]|jgi:hypothetical protein
MWDCRTWWRVNVRAVSEKTADRDIRIPVKRSGAGLVDVLCTNYGRHERRRSRAGADMELERRESERASNCWFAQCQCGGLSQLVWAAARTEQSSGALEVVSGAARRERVFKIVRSGGETINCSWRREVRTARVSQIHRTDERNRTNDVEDGSKGLFSGVKIWNRLICVLSHL